MKKYIWVILVLTLSSCDILLNTAKTMVDSNRPLSKEEVTQGLKSALTVSVDTAVTKLSSMNGYYSDPMVKINLPDEAELIAKYARKIPGLNNIIDDLEIQLNRSAEDAAREAKSIFIDAIKNMTIKDAMAILNGSDSAATMYLYNQTYKTLAYTYKPIVDESLNKPLVGNVSANNSWDQISGKWNNFANSYAGKLLDLEPVKYDLTQYVTIKALDGIFYKIRLEEIDIRQNAEARVNEILKRVFGSIEGKSD